MEFSDSDLTGQMLVAMPGMGDPRFEHSVVYLCAHSGDGSMGVIVNKPSEEVSFADLLEQLDLPKPGPRDMSVHFGGPVEYGRGFVLHSSDWMSEGSTLRVNAAFSLTGTLDILEAIAEGQGPGQAMLALGYAGWGPGQLEAEISANGWLTVAAREGIVWGPDDAGKWEAALRVIGIDPLTLSASAGRA